MGLFSDILKIGGSVASFIPGVAGWVGPAAQAIGGAMEAGDQQRRANRLARGAASTQQQQFQMTQDQYMRLTALQDLLRGYVEQYDKSGGFDPNQAIDRLERRQAEYDRLNFGNLAAASKTLGHQPGDLGPKQILAAAKAQSDKYLNLAREEAPLRYLKEKISAYMMTDPQMANAALGLSQNAANSYTSTQMGLANRADAQTPDVTGLLQSVLPYLKKTTPSTNPSVGGSDASTDSYGSFPTQTPYVNPFLNVFSGRRADLRPIDAYGN